VNDARDAPHLGACAPAADGAVYPAMGHEAGSETYIFAGELALSLIPSGFRSPT
jgi:hypothetical protein